MRPFVQWIVIGCACIALAGCTQAPKKQTSASQAAKDFPEANATRTAPITPDDACATRLQDLCGPLLLFYGQHHRLPNDLKELADEYDVGDLTCPVSHLPYIYNPEGLRGNDPKVRIIIYDATPAHSGIRWGIGLVEAQPGVAPVAKVVAVPNQVIPMQTR